MKILTVFYSRTGTTKKVAEELSKRLKSDTEEIIDLTDRSGIKGWLIGGRDAKKEKLTKIKPTKNDPSKYDLVVIGTPIWAWTVTPAVRTYLANNKSKIKKVAFFCTEGSSGHENAFKCMGESCGKKPINTLFLTTKDFKSGNHKVKLELFLKNLK